MISTSENKTIELGIKMGKKLKKGEVVALYGEFGAGKTVFIKGIVKGIGCEEMVKSPSFIYVHQYKNKIPIFHIDLYRINNIEDFMALGLYEFLNPESICLIEWAEKVEEILPKNKIEVKIKIIDKTKREIKCKYWE